MCNVLLQRLFDSFYYYMTKWIKCIWRNIVILMWATLLVPWPESENEWHFPNQEFKHVPSLLKLLVFVNSAAWTLTFHWWGIVWITPSTAGGCFLWAVRGLAPALGLLQTCHLQAGSCVSSAARTRLHLVLLQAARASVTLPDLRSVLLPVVGVWVPGGHGFRLFMWTKDPVSALTGTQCLGAVRWWIFGFLPGAAFLHPLADSKDKGSASWSGRTSLYLLADSQDLFLTDCEEGEGEEGKLLVFGFALKHLICR